MARFDVLRSMLRASADRARESLGDVAPLAAARKAFAEIRRQRLTLSERALTGVLAHMPGVRAATVVARHGALSVDVSYHDGTAIACRFEPVAARFAPRGAKELIFRVDPAEAVRDARTREIAGAFAGAIAHTLWAFALDRRPDVSGAIVDRDGEEQIRVDLRTVPAVREAQKKTTVAMMLEMMELQGVEIGDGELWLRIKLPTLGG